MYLAHRFYATRNLQAHPTDDVAVACILVASKVEETVRKIKEILLSATYILRNVELTWDHPDIDAYKKRIMVLERSVLESSVFDFNMAHPHKYLIKIVKQWATRVDAYKSMTARAWSLLEDRYDLG